MSGPNAAILQPPFFDPNADDAVNEPWYQPFDVKPGQKLYLAAADRVRIW